MRFMMAFQAIIYGKRWGNRYAGEHKGGSWFFPRLDHNNEIDSSALVAKIKSAGEQRMRRIEWLM
jgi:hypothetical protein